MFRLNQCSRVYGDETADYSVELIGEYTLGSFVKEVVSNEREWGYIGIDAPRTIFGEPYMEYKWGKELSQLPKELLPKKVVSVKARGGWSRMDYLITIEK